MECHYGREISTKGWTVKEDNRETQEAPCSGGERYLEDDVDKKGETPPWTEEKRQANGTLRECEARTRSTLNHFEKKWPPLVKSPITSCTQSCCFKRFSTHLVSIGVFICCAWLVMDLAGSSRCSGVAHSVYPVSLAVLVVEASSACTGNTDCVCSANESHENGDKSANKHPRVACHADGGKTTYNVARRKGDFVPQATASSTLVGDGFHRTMLTTVHILVAADEEDEKGRKEAKNVRKKLQNDRSGFGVNVNKQKYESERRLERAVVEGGEKERQKSEKEEGKESEEKKQEETRELQTGNEKKIWEGVSEWGASEEQTEQANRSSEAGRMGGERTRKREQNRTIVTLSEEERESNGRSADKRKTEIKENDKNDDKENIICTVTCEYTLDRIVYVDPDQTWELGGLKSSHATHDTGNAEENIFHTSVPTSFAQMGSVEVLAPAVDLEAPVFAPYLPSKLHVRQTIRDVVLLKRSSPSKEGRHQTAALNHGVRVNENADKRMHGVTVSEDLFSSSLSNSRHKHNEHHHLDPRRGSDGKKGGFYPAEEGKDNQTDDIISKHGSKAGSGNKNVHCEDQGRSGKENTDQNSCHEGSPVYGTLEDDNRRHRSGSKINASVPDEGKFEETNSSSFEAFVEIELPLHHRYDAACSGCGGFSPHHIQTPVVKVVCCRKEREMWEQAKSQLRGIVNESVESVRLTDAADISENCCDQQQQHHHHHHRRGRTHFPSTSEERRAASEAPTPRAASTPADYCISAKSITAVAEGGSRRQEKADWRFKNAASLVRVDAYDSESCQDPSASEKMTESRSGNAGATHSKEAGDGANQQESRQVDQAVAAEGDADRGRVKTTVDRTIWEDRRGGEGNRQYEELSVEVPVGSAEDLPWVTAVTLTTVGITMVLTAWILSYAQSRQMVVAVGR